MLIRSLWKQSNHHLSLGSSFIIQEGHSVLIWRAGNLMLLHVNSLTWNYCPWCDFTNKLVHFYLFARDFRDRGELYTSLVISPALFQVNTQFSSSLHHHVLFLPVALALALFHSGMNRQSYFFFLSWGQICCLGLKRSLRGSKFPGFAFYCYSNDWEKWVTRFCLKVFWAGLFVQVEPWEAKFLICTKSSGTETPGSWTDFRDIGLW